MFSCTQWTRCWKCSLTIFLTFAILFTAKKKASFIAKGEVMSYWHAVKWNVCFCNRWTRWSIRTNREFGCTDQAAGTFWPCPRKAPWDDRQRDRCIMRTYRQTDFSQQQSLLAQSPGLEGSVLAPSITFGLNRYHRQDALFTLLSSVITTTPILPGPDTTSAQECPVG